MEFEWKSTVGHFDEPYGRVRYVLECSVAPKVEGGSGLTIDLTPREGAHSVSFTGTTYIGRRDVGGGQNREDLLKVTDFVPGWTAELRDEVATLWERWHLPDLKPGCRHQIEQKWNERPIDPSKPTDAYGVHFAGQRSPSWNMLVWIPRSEHPEGLLSEPCETCGHRYGSAWLTEIVPDAVLERLAEIGKVVSGGGATA